MHPKWFGKKTGGGSVLVQAWRENVRDPWDPWAAWRGGLLVLGGGNPHGEFGMFWPMIFDMNPQCFFRQLVQLTLGKEVLIEPPGLCLVHPKQNCALEVRCGVQHCHLACERVLRTFHLAHGTTQLNKQKQPNIYILVRIIKHLTP